MDYREAMEFIHSARRFGSRPGLESVGSLLNLLGNPQKRLKFVHIAGTNGKGSVAAFLSSILSAAGYKTGVYTSPYIQRFSDRIRVGPEEITEEEIARCTGEIKKAVDRMLEKGEQSPTEFDLVTAMAFLHYENRGCDIVVLETGLGGRLDSTNIIECPEAAVITTINYDHMDVLGATLPEIAFEKAGIIKPGGRVVLYPQEPEIEAFFARVCAERGAALHKLAASDVRTVSSGPEGQVFDYGDHKALRIALLGAHQLLNAATAVLAAETLNANGFPVGADAIRVGLASARWPGRFEIIRKDPLLLIDGAHNPQGAAALRDGLLRYFPDRRFTFIAGVLRDKEYAPMTDLVAPFAARFLTVTPESPRALGADRLAAFLNGRGYPAEPCETVAEAVRKSARFGEPTCAFGSLYFIGKIRDYFGLR